MAHVIHVAEAIDGSEVAVMESSDGQFMLSEYDANGHLVEMSNIPDCWCRATAKGIARMSPLGYAGFPADIAAAAVYLASDDGRYVSGHALVVDAGQTSSGMSLSPMHVGENRQIHEAGRVT